ncbi:hypothetical protein [Longitalea arenae]|uniref:hypothetical protein n=1 Tax=Longitalea arenae TaxID=2812558 RepID=UPI001967DA5F|nr:hypothetical protein [Longitalea arenae]
MKKLLLVLAIGSLFAVACNDGGSAEAEKTADTASTTPTVDTAAAPAPTVDTAAAATVDTTKKADTTKKK